MAASWSKPFYNSKQWKVLRKAVWSRSKGLCEHCLKDGIVAPGYEVHHIIELTPENIDDPSIALNSDNLVVLCHECHDKVHNRNKRRYRIDPITGAVSV